MLTKDGQRPKLTTVNTRKKKREKVMLNDKNMLGLLFP